MTADELIEKVLASKKPYVVVNLYATYCTPCLIELPDLAQINESPESQAEVLFVSIDDPAVLKDKKLAVFLRDLNVNEGSYHMNPELVDAFVLQYAPNWNRQIPLNLVFARDGRLVLSTGMTDQHEISMIVLKDRSFH